VRKNYQLRSAIITQLEHYFEWSSVWDRLFHSHGGFKVQHLCKLAKRDKVLLPRPRQWWTSP